MAATDTAVELEELNRALRLIVHASSRARLHEHLLDAAHIKMDRAGFGVLARVAEWAPLRLSDLAQRTNVDVSTVSRQVHRLEADGLVRRVPDADDRRASLLEPTREGRRALRRLRQAWCGALADVTADWSIEDRQGFAKLLHRFADDLIDYGERL